MPLIRRRRRHRHRASSPAVERPRAAIILGGAVVAVLAAAGLVFFLNHPTTTTPVPHLPYVPPGTPQPGDPTPAVVIPSPAGPGSSLWPEPGIMADHITITRLGIDLDIIEGDGIDVPLTKVAHYPGTAWPTGGSNIYLYGHAREGVFFELLQAQVGDIAEVHLIDGTTHEYRIDEILPEVAWNAIELLQPTQTEQLTLQTCVTYGTTEPRFVALAHPVR